MATFTNQAQLSYNNSTASSNVAVGELVSVLSAEKTVLNPDYTNGDTITYIVNLVNTCLLYTSSRMVKYTRMFK